MRSTKVLFVLLGVVFLVGGLVALAGADAVRDSWARLGVSDALGTVIAVLEVLAGIGLLLGLRRTRLGVAAAVGIVALMVGAVVYHVRAEDWAGLGGPVVLGALAAAAALTARTSLRRRVPVT